MRKSLESRIETLESAIMAGHRFDAIAITLVSPGNLSPDIDHIQDRDGREWVRQSGESKDDFFERAKIAAQSTAKGLPWLIVKEVGEHHAQH